MHKKPTREVSGPILWGGWRRRKELNHPAQDAQVHQGT
jgi:hypothetical protein